jgi:hypothetical protein
LREHGTLPKRLNLCRHLLRPRSLAAEVNCDIGALLGEQERNSGSDTA